MVVVRFCVGDLHKAIPVLYEDSGAASEGGTPLHYQPPLAVIGRKYRRQSTDISMRYLTPNSLLKKKSMM